MMAHELKERLEESEKLIRERTITWEEKLRKTEGIAQVDQRQDHATLIRLEGNKMISYIHSLSLFFFFFLPL